MKPETLMSASQQARWEEDFCAEIIQLGLAAMLEQRCYWVTEISVNVRGETRPALFPPPKSRKSQHFLGRLGSVQPSMKTWKNCNTRQAG